MKKLLSLIGALFIGVVAFAQATKADTAKTDSARKVMPEDLKNLPVSNGTDSLALVDSSSVQRHTKHQTATKISEKRSNVTKEPTDRLKNKAKQSDRKEN